MFKDYSKMSIKDLETMLVDLDQQLIHNPLNATANANYKFVLRIITQKKQFEHEKEVDIVKLR